MAAPKLTTEQQQALLEWLAAEYSAPLINKWFKDREWATLTDGAFTYYRKKWADEIEAARALRRGGALNTGLAIKEERVKRLVEHADELEAIKWLPDDKGWLRNEKSWRETLDDIAKEMGHRRAGIDLDVVDRERTALLEQLKTALSPEVYAQVAAALMGRIGSSTA